MYTGAAGAGSPSGQTLTSHCEADVKRQGRSQLQGTQAGTALCFVREPLEPEDPEDHSHLINRGSRAPH